MTPFSSSPLLRGLTWATFGGALSLGLGGCEILGQGGTPEAPGASLTTVALVEYPSYDKLASWFCHDLAGNNVIGKNACELAFGKKPRKPQLKFVFDTRFELSNPNSFPIPLVEILLGFNVFEGIQQEELGAICVSFCDPDAEDCDLAREDACRPPDKTVKGIEDLIPSKEDLITIANRAVNGDLLSDENLRFRVIPPASAEQCREGEEGDEAGECPGRVEANISFELGIEAMLSIIKTFVGGSVNSFISGGGLDITIPYSAFGTLFFDVPVLGRYAVEFGPLKGEWSLN